MFIWPGSDTRKGRVTFFAVLVAALLVVPTKAEPCSCEWRGPFLTVAAEAPLVAHVRVLRHHPGPNPAMDALVLEVITGGLLDSGVKIQMGDGMHCRPGMEGFPVGSEWILALNGPGAKPGKGMALSSCGEYWLRIQGDEAVGNFDGAQGEQKRKPLSELRLRLRFPKSKQKFKGRVEAGARFQQAFGPGFQFVLEPRPTGWEMVILERGREENLARLTPPLHFVPNPREIESWQFVPLSTACPRPYGAEAGPENPRTFIFSPEVGRRIDGSKANRSVIPEEVEAIGRFGRGTFTIERFSVGPGSNGCGLLEWIEFSVQLEWGL
jgi:hypothetical protein